MLGFWVLLSRISTSETLECHLFFAVGRFKTLQALQACGLPNIRNFKTFRIDFKSPCPSSIMAPVLRPLDAFGTSLPCLSENSLGEPSIPQWFIIIFPIFLNGYSWPLVDISGAFVRGIFGFRASAE